MLFVLSKEKILSYVIAFSTVAILIGISAVSTQDNNTIETAGNYVHNNVVNVINME